MNKFARTKIDNEAILGKNASHIDFQYFECPLHKTVIFAVQKIKQKASEAGYELALASGYRGFDQQLTIWNEKAQGKRIVLDSDEAPVDIESLSPTELMFAILRWSALPGASRHHWGTDFDIYDARALKEGYRLQLTVAETVKGGPFEDFYLWLEQELSLPACQFSRPYSEDNGGVAPEPWHLSFFNLAQEYEAQLNIDLLCKCVREADILLKDEILNNLDEIYHRFVVTTN